MKVISFSLWGNDPKYVQGAIENARLARDIYPDWQVWFYFGQSVDRHSRFEIMSQNHNSRSTIMPTAGDWRGMFWRFEPILSVDTEAMIVRDCDSRLTLREKAAVDEWMESDAGFHIMRDHPYHGTQILGGMWGIKQGCLPEFGQLMSVWNAEDRWQTDQDFLKAEVYPRVVHNSMVHDEFFSIEPHRRNFPTPRAGCDFVGQVFEADGSTPQEHIQPIAEYLIRKK